MKHRRNTSNASFLVLEAPHPPSRRQGARRRPVDHSRAAPTRLRREPGHALSAPRQDGGARLAPRADPAGPAPEGVHAYPGWEAGPNPLRRQVEELYCEVVLGGGGRSAGEPPRRGRGTPKAAAGPMSIMPFASRRPGSTCSAAARRLVSWGFLRVPSRRVLSSSGAPGGGSTQGHLPASTLLFAKANLVTLLVWGHSGGRRWSGWLFAGPCAVCPLSWSRTANARELAGFRQRPLPRWVAAEA
jgi:hypothetical protein